MSGYRILNWSTEKEWNELSFLKPIFELGTYTTGFSVTEANWRVFNNALTTAEIVIVNDEKINEVN